ncbi:hypothetical protein [Lentzea sp. NPDC004782]|uniref:hypothetical protein n=1 Tax=Lentzea sp. NPDC004782 TaxID=3154458 RepID=UPI0033BD3EDC
MRIDVLEVLDPSRGWVFFSSDFGSASGRWTNPDVRTGQFDVEFSLPQVEEWKAEGSGEAALSGAAEPGAAVWIRCQVEQVHDGDDTVVIVRMGPHIMYVEILNRRADLPEGNLISFRVPEIRLYPYQT